MTTDLADDLADRLRTALRSEAARAPLTAPEWADASYVATAPATKRRSPWLPAAAALAVAVAAAGVMAFARGSADRRSFEHARPLFVQGAEEVLEPADVPTGFRPAGVVKPGTLRALRRAGSEFIDVVYVAAMGGPQWAEVQCVDTNGGGGCNPLESLAVSAGGDMAEPPNPGWYPLAWGRLPDGTAYVQLVDADGLARWQVPVAGIAVFSNPGGHEPRSLTALDRNGTVLATASAAQPTQRLATPLLDITLFEGDATTQLVATSLTVFPACLERAGAAGVHAPLGPTFPDGVDGDAVWSRCVAEASAAIVAKADELRRG